MPANCLSKPTTFLEDHSNRTSDSPGYTCERRSTPCFCSHAIIAPMITKLAHVSILVPDLDEALDWYTNVLGLEKREDNSSVVAGFRWLTVAPKGQTDPEIVLFLPGPFQAEEDRKILLSRVGEGTMWMFHTDDCAKEYTKDSRGWASNSTRHPRSCPGESRPSSKISMETSSVSWSPQTFNRLKPGQLTQTQ